jgi:hypothetical protein
VDLDHFLFVISLCCGLYDVDAGGKACSIGFSVGVSHEFAVDVVDAGFTSSRAET